MNPQVPSMPPVNVDVQPMQSPSQEESQHTPSTQWLLAQSHEDQHASPLLDRATQTSD